MLFPPLFKFYPLIYFLFFSFIALTPACSSKSVWLFVYCLSAPQGQGPSPLFSTMPWGPGLRSWVNICSMVCRGQSACLSCRGPGTLVLLGPVPYSPVPTGWPQSSGVSWHHSFGIKTYPSPVSVFCKVTLRDTSYDYLIHT